jgi:hypothetical protein
MMGRRLRAICGGDVAFDRFLEALDLGCEIGEQWSRSGTKSGIKGGTYLNGVTVHNPDFPKTIGLQLPQPIQGSCLAPYLRQTPFLGQSQSLVVRPSGVVGDTSAHLRVAQYLTPKFSQVASRVGWSSVRS